jgi:hypothetical protein
VPRLRGLLGPGQGWCLDIACGTGIHFEAITVTGRRVLGVDIALVVDPRGFEPLTFWLPAQSGLNAVLTCRNAGQERAERPLSFAEANVLAEIPHVHRAQVRRLPARCVDRPGVHADEVELTAGEISRPPFRARSLRWR